MACTLGTDRSEGEEGMKMDGRTIEASEPQAEEAGFSGLVGRHVSMQRMFDVVRRVAPTDATCLISGESGTGKELIASAIHRHSKRAGQRFVPVHCGAIPEDLLESEMFGHERGAFTGAIASRVGRFKLADGGTIFLDEIGEMSPKLQVKLLRVLEDGRFEPVGSVATQQVDVRIVAATNRSLEEAVANRQFREDLFYRLRVVPIEMPPLRQRGAAIRPLTNGILAQLVSKGLPEVTVTPAAMELLERYSWPGNVRELRNVLEQMVVLGNAEHVIDVPQLPPHLLAARDVADDGISMPWQFGSAGIDFYREMEAIEDRIIAQALRLSGGNKKEAARLLRVNRTTLLEKLKRKRAQGSPLAMLLGPPRTPAPTDGRLFVGEETEPLPPLPLIGGA